MSAIEAKLGKRIAAERGLVGLSQAQLAERIGVATETISRLERGVAVPSLARIESIADALEISLHDLFRMGGDSSRDRMVYRFAAIAGHASAQNVDLALHIAEAVLGWLEANRQ
jgi:transcriptional regulator with XRE-family HTH domain